MLISIDFSALSHGVNFPSSRQVHYKAFNVFHDTANWRLFKNDVVISE